MKRRFLKYLQDAGIVVKWRNELTSFEYQRFKMMSREGIEACIDCGANVGQYAARLRDSGFNKLMISIEPAIDAFARLEDISRADSNWDVYRCAVGNMNGLGNLNITKNSVSSSLLIPKATEFNVAAGAVTTSTEKVEVVRLDQFVSQKYPHLKCVLLKLDVQGYEDVALSGASGILDRIQMVELELGIDVLYEGAADWVQLISNLRHLQYELVAIQPNTIDKLTSRAIEFNAIFSRPTSSSGSRKNSQ